jgi:hypothetical protein
MVHSAARVSKPICAQQLRTVFEHFGIEVTPKRGRPKAHISPTLREVTVDERFAQGFGIKLMLEHLQQPEFSDRLEGVKVTRSAVRHIFEEQEWHQTGRKGQ